MSLQLRILIAIWSTILAIALCEFTLGLISPTRQLGFDGFKDGVWYTWGHRVAKNSDGFRDEELPTEKPVGSVRLMFIGDSLTWGAGLALDDRFSNLVETQLRGRFSGHDIQALNFGLRGIPTVLMADIVRKFAPIVKPDLIIVGFCLNDPQPRPQTWSVERSEIDATWLMKTYRTIYKHLLRSLIPEIAQLFDNAVYRALELLNVIPTSDEALARTYRQNSTEWQSFVRALGEIKATSDGLGLPAPLFIILNQALRNGTATDYREISEHLYLEWYAQAAAAAADSGFLVTDVRQEIAAASPEMPLRVNVLDGHPSRELNRIYANKLLPMVEPIVRKILGQPEANRP